MKEVKFEKQILPFEAEPNTAKPRTDIVGNDVLIRFARKDSSQYAKILFTDCLLYRVGDPNDEGFYTSIKSPKKNETIWSSINFPQIEFWEFYKVEGLDWKENTLGKSTIILNDDYKTKEGYSHFIYFMKDGTFECVAKGYQVK